MTTLHAGAQQPDGNTAQRPVTVLDAPSNLGLRPLRPGHIPGAWRLSTALRSHGLMNLPGVEDAGTVPAPAYNPDAAPSHGFRNGRELRDYSLRLAERLQPLITRDSFTLVLGGDCSILVGAGLALKRQGRYGLVFIDGHTDYPFPKNPKRFATGMTAAGLDLGLATGHGPKELSAIEDRAPYFRETDVAVLGYRYNGDPVDYDLTAWNRSAMFKQPLEDVRRTGPAASAQRALAHLDDPDLDGIWIHLDADVVDPEIMPAVDSPEDAGGMTFEELEAVLTPLVRSPRVVGLEFTIFDPDLDPDGRFARQWVALLGRVLSQRP